MNITAINKKYQSLVNRFIKWNAKYDQIVADTGDNGGRLQQNAYDKASECWEELTQRERANIIKSIPDVKGGY